MSERSGKVQTVLGLVQPSELGFTHPHEHLLIELAASWINDLSLEQLRQMLCSGAQEGFPMTGLQRIVCEEMPADLPDIRALEFTAENLGTIRRYWALHPLNMRLTSEAEAIEEMKAYKNAGGGALVEMSLVDIGRNPEGLKRISEATGIHVVMGTGHYVSLFHPPEVAEASEDQIAERIVEDLIEGVDGTGIKSGVIGEIGLEHPMHENEKKVLRAASRAQAGTGAAMNIHLGRNTASPFDAIAVVKEAGGDPERTVMSHIDRTLFSLEDMLRLAESGCYLEWDLFGQESSFYPIDPIDMPNDAVRIDCLMKLMDAGYRDKLLISQDICSKHRLTRYGGEGYSHILRNVLPVMKRKGMSAEDIETITVRNPARMLAFL